MQVHMRQLLHYKLIVVGNRKRSLSSLELYNLHPMRTSNVNLL